MAIGRPNYVNRSQGGYYDPSSLYGLERHYSQEPWGQAYEWGIHGPQGYLEQNPSATYYRFISPWASGTDQFSRFVQSEMSRVMQGFGAARSNNPDLLLQQYLSGLGRGSFEDQWAKAHPASRGVDASRRGGGRVQWLV
jgi:hypothetical protein